MSLGPKQIPLNLTGLQIHASKLAGTEGLLVKRAFSPQAWRGSCYLFHLKCLCNWGQRKQLQVTFLLGSNYPTIVLRAPVSFCTCTCGRTPPFLHRTVLETLLSALWVTCQSEEVILPPKPGLRAAGPGVRLPNPTAGLLLCPRVEWGLGGPQVPSRGGALVEIPFLLRGLRCGCNFGFQRDFGKEVRGGPSFRDREGVAGV